jgi:hypothetical protein
VKGKPFWRPVGTPVATMAFKRGMDPLALECSLEFFQ